MSGRKKKSKRPPTKAVRLRRVKKALSALWSKVVRMRDGNRCLMCGKTKGLSAHHWLFAKGHCQPLAYNVCNGATLCYACHVRKLHQNGDGDFILRLCDIMFTIVGEDAVARMRRTAAEKPELDLETMESMRGILQKVLDSGDMNAVILARSSPRGDAAIVGPDGTGVATGACAEPAPQAPAIPPQLPPHHSGRPYCAGCWGPGTEGYDAGPVTNDGLVHRVRLDSNMSVCGKWRLGA